MTATLGYKKIIGLVLVVALAAATGLSVGKIFLDMNTPPSGLTALVSDFKASDAELTALHNRTKTEGVMSFNGIELWQIAEYNLLKQDKFKREMTGRVVSAGQPVALRSIKVKNGNSLTYEKLSPSKNVVGITTPNICSFIKYDYSNPNKIEIIKDGVFENKNAESQNLKATFPSSGEIYTAEQYFSIFHAQPNESVLPFIISEKVCDKSASSVVTDNGDGTYTFVITLTGESLEKAALYYSYEILFSSGYSLPKWKDEKITVTIDSNFMFKTINYKENYSVYNAPVIGKADVADDFYDVFTYGDEAVASMEV